VFWDPYVKSRPRGRSAARAPARAQVMQRAHAAAAAATARARNATEHRAGGYNQGAFPGSLPVLNRTVNGTSSVIVGNGTFPASQQTMLHQARICCLEIGYRVPYPVCSMPRRSMPITAPAAAVLRGAALCCARALLSGLVPCLGCCQVRA